MNATTLRDLSRAYAVGALDRETYRKQRHHLLTQIVAGKLPMLAYQAPEPEQRTVFPSAEEDGDTTQEILAPLTSLKVAAMPTKSKLPLLAMLGVLALGGVAAWYFFKSDRATAPPARAASTNSPARSDPLAQFLSTNQWHGPQLEALGARWDELDETTRAQLRDAPTMRRLTDKTLQQIQAENALITLGDAEDPLATQQQLLDLMDRLGAEDARLRSAREAWRRASAEFAQKRIAQARARVATTTTPLPLAQPPANEPSAAAPAPVAPAAIIAAPAPLEISAATAPVSKPVVAIAAPTTITAVTPTSAVAATTTPDTANEPRQARPARGNCKASLAKTRRPYCQDALAELGKGPALVALPAGQFEMGGEAQEEQPRHAVTFERSFAIGLFEVSAAEFAQYCTATQTRCPSQPWDNPALPVVNVSWAAANAYAQWLSKTSGAEYRLPSEAEWEYAARAGSITPYPNGSELLPTYARYSFKATESTPLPANDRSVNHNDFKLYHMLGNVREWVADAWQAGYGNASPDGRVQSGGDARHVVRGGSYADRATALRSAARLPLDANGDQFTGFRVVRALE